MSANPQPLNCSGLIGERVQGLKEYAPEPLEEIALRLGLPVDRIIKLDANENPYGPTEGTHDVLSSWAYPHRYPDPISRQLRLAIGRYIGVDSESILVGNGSDELIDLVLRLFRPGPQGGGIGQVIDCPPTFGMYRFYAATNDMQLLEYPRKADFSLDVESIEGLCRGDPRPRALFLASPNNPDGQVLSNQDLIRLLALPLLIVLDEAYVEFSGSSRVGWVSRHDNLIVLRTFSKWAGLAGLRVGYGVFPRNLMSALWRLKSPYNVNGLAQAAALATLQDIDGAQANIERIVAERERLQAMLREIPWLRVYDSRANYVLCRVTDPSIETIRQAMERRGIMIRYFDAPRLKNCIRISVGRPEQSQAVLEVLRGLRR